MSVTNLVIHASIIEDTLCQCCLTSIDMGHNTNISGSLKWIFSSSQVSFLLLESVMCESFVSFCHLMHIFFLLYRRTGVVGSIHNLFCQSFFHGSLASLAGVKSDPAKSQCLTSVWSYINRYLISSTTDTSGFYFQSRHNVIHGICEHFKSILACLLCYALKSTVNNSLSNTFLTI